MAISPRLATSTLRNIGAPYLAGHPHPGRVVDPADRHRTAPLPGPASNAGFTAWSGHRIRRLVRRLVRWCDVLCDVSWRQSLSRRGRVGWYQGPGEVAEGSRGRDAPSRSSMATAVPATAVPADPSDGARAAGTAEVPADASSAAPPPGVAGRPVR